MTLLAGTIPLIIFSPALVFLAASLIALVGMISQALKAERIAEEKARAEAEAKRIKQVAAILREERRTAQAAEKAAAREAKRKFTADELLKDAPEGAKPFKGQRIAFTGRFPRVERADLCQVVNALGGRGHDTTHAGTTLLVICPRSGSTQIDKADHWKIPTITWDEWYKQAFGKAPGPEFTQAVL